MLELALNRTGERLGGQNPVYIYGKMDGDNSKTDHAMIIMAIWIDKLTRNILNILSHTKPQVNGPKLLWQNFLFQEVSFLI